MAVTALDYLHALAEESAEYGTFATTSDGTSTSLICSKLANTRLAASELSDMWALIESGACAGQVGTLKTLTRATGAVSFHNTLTTSVLSGVTFSLYRLLPPTRTDVLPGWLTVLNQSLRRLWVPDTISFSGTTGLIHYPVDTDAYPWWTDGGRIIAVRYPVTGADDVPRELPRQSWSWVSDGETRYLQIPSAPFRTGETFTVRVYRPANSRLKLNATAYAIINAGLGTVTAATVVTGGYYTDTPGVAITGGGGTGATATATLNGTAVASIAITNAGTGYTTAPVVTVGAGAWGNMTSATAGLAAITDQALVDVNDMVVMGKAVLYELLSRIDQPAADVAEWLRKGQPNIRAARGLMRAGLPREAATGVLAPRHAAFGTQVG